MTRLAVAATTRKRKGFRQWKLFKPKLFRLGQFYEHSRTGHELAHLVRSYSRSQDTSQLFDDINKLDESAKTAVLALAVTILDHEGTFT
jgi:hypothetical protein